MLLFLLIVKDADDEFKREDSTPCTGGRKEDYKRMSSDQQSELQTNV